MNIFYSTYNLVKEAANFYLPDQERIVENGVKIKEVAGKAFTAGKGFAIKGAVWYQGFGRGKHLQLLQKLLNRNNIEVELTSLSIPLTLFFKNSNPDAYALLSQGNQNTFQNMIEGLILYIGVNCAAKLYPEKMRLLKQRGEIAPDQMVSLDQFCADLMAFVYPIILEEWFKVNGDELQGMPITPHSFSTLVDRLLDLILPQEEASYISAAKATSNRALYRHYSQDHLKELFYALFLKSIAKNDQPAQALASDLLQPLFRNLLPCLIRSIAIAFGPFREEEERCWSQLSTFFMGKYGAKIRERLPLLQSVTDHDLSRLVSALCIRAVKNLTPQDEDNAFRFDHLLIYLRSQFFICFQSIRRKRGLNQKVLRKDFLPIAKNLLEKLLLDQPMVNSLIQQRVPLVLNIATSLLMEMESSFQKNLSLELQKQKLRELFWDREQFLKNMKVAGDLPESPIKEFSILFKVEDLINQIETLCQHVGYAVVLYLKEALNDPQNVEALSEYLQMEDLNPILRSAFHLLAKREYVNDEFMRWVQNQIAGILFSILSLSLQKGAAKAGREQSLYKFVEQLITLFITHMPERKEDPDNFKTLSRELIVLLFETDDGRVSLDHYIPLPGSFALSFAELVKSTLLPRMLQFIDQEFMSLVVTKQAEKQKLGNRYLDALSIVLGKYVREFVPSYLEQEGERVAASLVDELKSYLLKKPEQLDEGDFEAALEQGVPHPMVGTLIKNCLITLSQDKNPIAEPMFSLLGRYTESVLRRAMIHLSRHLKELEVKRAKAAEGILLKRPQVEVVRDVLVVMHAHMERVNLVTNNLRAKNSREVAEDVLFAHFRLNNELHPLMNPQAPAQSVTYLRDFSRKLNGLLGLRNGDELPAPELIKSLLNDWIQHLLPIIWQELLKEAKSQDAIENYLRSLLVSIQKPLEKDEQLNPMVYVGPVQEEIELVSGKLLQELIGLHPTVAEALIRYRGVSELIGRAVGQSLRGALENYSVQELFNQLIRNTLPSLHPGRWVTEEAWQVWKETGEMPPLNPAASAERFFPLRKRKNGEIAYGWDFSIPRTSKAKEEKLLEEREAKALRNKKVRQALKENIEQQAKLSLDAGAAGLWNDFQKSFDQAFAELFGAEGTALKNAMDRILSVLWTYILHPLIKVAAYPINKLLEILLGYYCAMQARARVHEITHPIHQNAILGSIDSIVNFLFAHAN